MNITLCFISFIFFFLSSAHAENIRLEQCGRVVGHEMGLWENFQLRASPNQMDQVLNGAHNFYKISLHKTKDGKWIVNHDADIYIRLAGELPKKVMIKDLTWNQILTWRHNPDNYAPIFRLKEYVQRDHGKICWMLGMKDPADETFIEEIKKLHLENRAVVLATSVKEYELMMKNASALGLQWTARIFKNIELLSDLKPYYANLWAVEIDPSAKTQSLIYEVKSLGLKTYVDSMRYSWNYELTGSVCKKVFNMGVDYTQTNRPRECLEQL